MPFTLSHPAAVLPLLRRPFSAAALVAGAVAPDMPYFARSTPIPVTAQSWYEPLMNATTSHGLPGAVTVSLPYAVALWGLFLVARRPVGGLLAAGGLGAAADGRPSAEPSGASDLVRRAEWVLVSLLIGIATHLLWDSFTHGDGYVVLHVPFLSDQLAGDLTWARALQHVSTVGGLVVLGVYLWRRRTRLLARLGGRRRVRRLVGIVGGVAAVGAVANTVELWGDTGLSVRDSVELALSSAATGAGAALGTALLLYVVVWWAAHVLKARATAQAAASRNGSTPV